MSKWHFRRNKKLQAKVEKLVKKHGIEKGIKCVWCHGKMVFAELMNKDDKMPYYYCTECGDLTDGEDVIFSEGSSAEKSSEVDKNEVI